MNFLQRAISVASLLAVIAGANSMHASAVSTSETVQTGMVTEINSAPSFSSKIKKVAPRAGDSTADNSVNEWLQEKFELVRGYMHESYLEIHSSQSIDFGCGNVTGNKVNVRSGPGTDYRVLLQVNKGDIAYIIGVNNQWYKVICSGRIGYISCDYLEISENPANGVATASSPLFFIKDKDAISTPDDTSELADQIISNAKKHIGTPYSYGGSKPGGFDCSGFTSYIMKQSGISLPRTTTDQYKVGTYVEKSDLKPGDLVFMANTYRSGISHVGIYVGNGCFIHASSSRGITIDDLSEDYYVKHYYGSRRILN